MAYAGLTGILTWKRMKFNSRGHKAFLGFIVFYIAASIPIHFATFVTNSTEFVRSFPMWFSILLLPYYIIVIVTLVRLQYKDVA